MCWAIGYAAELLIQQARSNTAIAAVIQDLLTVSEFAEAHLEMIENQGRDTPGKLVKN
jgi:gamma-glutamyl phosphate reductase